MPMFQNASVNALMINVQVNEDYQMTGGEIVTEYNPSSPFVYDGRKDRTETTETTTTTTSTSTATTASASTEITIENEIDTVFINDDGKIVVLDTAGNATTHEIPKDENGEDKAVTITDGAGNSYTVEGGEVKSSSPSETTTSNDSVSSESSNELIWEGISENRDWVSILNVPSEFTPGDEDRMQIRYRLLDTPDLDYSLLSIYKISENDTVLVEFYDNLPFGDNMEFLDSHDENKKSWSGKNSDGEFVEPGEYLIELLAGSDPDFINGLRDYEVVEVKSMPLSEESIINLLSSIHEAKKEENKTFDLGSYVSSNSGQTNGTLPKRKVNATYEVKQLEVIIYNGNNTTISLEETEILISEDADKNKYSTLKFKANNSNKTVLEIKVKKEDQYFVEWYLMEKKPLFKITTTQVESGDYATISSFSINQGNLSGYFLERPAGTSVQERTAGSYKRIPEGDYKICYTYKQCRAATTRSNADNETWIKTYGETDNTGATITREYVLIHTGNYPWNSAGCLLIGGGYSNYKVPANYDDEPSGTFYQKDLEVRQVSDSGTKLTALNNEYKKLIDLTKKFDNYCETNKCYEMEIEINR